MNKSFYDVQEEMNQVANEFISELTEVSPEALGLDYRSASRLYISPEGIAVNNASRRTLEYYGGFEYVNKENVSTLGEYTFYMADDNRVKNYVESYFEEETE